VSSRTAPRSRRERIAARPAPLFDELRQLRPYSSRASCWAIRPWRAEKPLSQQFHHCKYGRVLSQGCQPALPPNTWDGAWPAVAEGKHEEIDENCGGFIPWRGFREPRPDGADIRPRAEQQAETTGQQPHKHSHQRTRTKVTRAAPAVRSRRANNRSPPPQSKILPRSGPNPGEQRQHSSVTRALRVSPAGADPPRALSRDFASGPNRSTQAPRLRPCWWWTSPSKWAASATVEAVNQLLGGV
jgi:hypothetical protein